MCQIWSSRGGESTSSVLAGRLLKGLGFMGPLYGQFINIEDFLKYNKIVESEKIQ